MLPALVLACWRAADEADVRFDPALHRIIAESPDSTIGVLIRTRAPTTPEQLAAIAATGLRVGSAGDTIVTARGRAADAAKLAELAFIVHVQLATTLRPGP
jgi:hypothetical protein